MRRPGMRGVGLAVVAVAVAALAGAGLTAAPALAATTTVGPGQQLTLDQDLVLADADVLDAQGTPEAPCVIEGNGNRVSAPEGWQGRLVIRHCTIHGLGRVDANALDIRAGGAAEILLEGNTFDASGGMLIAALDAVTVDVIGNTVLDTAVIDVLKDSADNSTPAWLFRGYANTTLKRFQGNRVFRGRVHFDSVQHWLVGGDNPGEGNIMIGLRGGIFARGNDIRIVGNYIRFEGDLEGWNQVKPLELQDGGFIVEHNVIRTGNWLVDLLGSAEIRYNLLGDSHDRPWLIVEQGDGVQKIHHNVFMRNNPAVDVDGAWVLRPESASPAEIYNNTFYGGGTCWRRGGPALALGEGGFLASLRSNAFVGFATNLGADSAIVRGGIEPPYAPKTPAPEQLGYADYNLFSNPGAGARDNYALAVPGKRERLDPGFALNDAPAGGSVDDQVDPRFAAGTQIPVAFPFSDDDIKAGTTTVCQILAFYRSVFQPAPGSPLIGTGDPADGAGNNIGAIGGPDDRFGMLCATGDVGSPNLAPETYTCPAIGPTGGGGAGGRGGHGFVCVCDVAAAPPPAAALLALLAAAACLRLRPRRGRRD